MKKLLLCTFAILAGGVWFASSVALGQVYDWDGEVDGDWNTPANWDLEASPGTDPASPPDSTIRVEIALDSGNTPLIQAGDVTFASEVRIGRSEGAGLLTMTGGSLTVSGNRFRVGSGGNGTFNMSGGTLTLNNQSFVTGSTTNGQVNISGGTINIVGSAPDFNMDEGAPGAASNLTMTSGAINVGDIFLVDEDATVNFSGGTIVSDDDLRIRKNAVVTITGGSWETKDKLELGDTLEDGGSLFINGGTLRAFRLEDPLGATSLIEINGSGILEFANSQLSVAAAQSLIALGTFSTSELAPKQLGAMQVGDFTQISVVPEPTAIGLLGLASVLLLSARRRQLR